MTKSKVEFGDFQTPAELATRICRHLYAHGIRPDVVVEPTCGVGAFVLAAAREFPAATRILASELNPSHLAVLRESLPLVPNSNRIELDQGDFFRIDWQARIRELAGSVLVIGNFPWVTNAVQGVIGGSNLPAKSNFHMRGGFDSISGKANFDISEWMLLEVLRWFKDRAGDVAMLVKTAVARKILAHAEQQQLPIQDAFLIKIDAKREFQAAVEACLLVLRHSGDGAKVGHDYTVFESLSDRTGRRVGHRRGLTVSDLGAFKEVETLVGSSPQKWRSGIKHDAAAVMELSRSDGGFRNGRDEQVEIEPEYLYPLLKGSDIGSGKPWRDKYVLVTQRFVGEKTNPIAQRAPKTWAYLETNAPHLDGRASTIYKKNPRFSVFGVGDYTFRPWRIAICGLYKALRFRLTGPIEGRPVMFDDTVYYLSFDMEAEARETLEKLNSAPAEKLLLSLIFWDEKRPIKTSILNVLDWSRLETARAAELPRQGKLSLPALPEAREEELVVG